MKLSGPVSLVALALSTHKCNAFSTSRSARSSTVALNAANSEDDGETGLMTRRTAAALLLSTSASLVSGPVVAADTQLDFSLPSYDPKMAGFGEGSEAYVKKGTLKSGSLQDKLMTDPGADEKEKQRAAMAKAEEARKEAKERKKAEIKEREEEAKRRAKEKKARDKERLKNMFADFDE